MASSTERNHNLEFCRMLRRNQTAAEEQLWGLLRGRAVQGAKFRRQVHVCGWVVDFACISHGLIVELDGAVHDLPEKLERDQTRDAWLRDNGWTILRFRNNGLREDPGGVINAIGRALDSITSATPRRTLSRIGDH